MTQRNRRNLSPGGRGFKAWGEGLDTRILLSGITVVVDTTSDTPAAFAGMTLREAIEDVDTMGNPTSPNSILFQIPKSDPGYNPANGTFTISPMEGLPPITKPVLLDGTSESTFLGEPALVVIDGSHQGRRRLDRGSECPREHDRRRGSRQFRWDGNRHGVVE